MRIKIKGREHRRPPRFRPTMIDEIAEMTGDGMTIRQIAAFYNVDERTLYKWAQKYPAVKDALQLGRTWQAEKITESMFKRAVGYEYEETKKIIDTGIGKDGKSSLKSTRVEKTIKHVAPDPTSAIFLLKNIMPGRFRDKWDIEHTGPRPIVIGPEYEMLLRAKEVAERDGNDLQADEGAT